MLKFKLEKVVPSKSLHKKGQYNTLKQSFKNISSQNPARQSGAGSYLTQKVKAFICCTSSKPSSFGTGCLVQQ